MGRGILPPRRRDAPAPAIVRLDAHAFRPRPPRRPDPNPWVVPLIVSSELVSGPSRFLFSLTDAKNALIAAPDLATTVRFYDLAADPATPVTETDGVFIWTVPDEI